MRDTDKAFALAQIAATIRAGDPSKSMADAVVEAFTLSAIAHNLLQQLKTEGDDKASKTEAEEEIDFHVLKNGSCPAMEWVNERLAKEGRPTKEQFKRVKNFYKAWLNAGLWTADPRMFEEDVHIYREGRTMRVPADELTNFVEMRVQEKKAEDRIRKAKKTSSEKSARKNSSGNKGSTP